MRSKAPIDTSLALLLFAIASSSIIVPAVAWSQGRVPKTPQPPNIPRTQTPHIKSVERPMSVCGVDSTKPFREVVVNGRGKLLVNAYRCVARNFNTPEIVNYRLGPKATDFTPNQPTVPTLWGPNLSGNGLWPFGTQPTSNPGEPNKCVVSSQLPRSDEEERARGMRGNGWLVGGQRLMIPDSNAPAAFRYGVSNVSAADGNVFDTGGLCMRMFPTTSGDWWIRNNIGNAATPEVVAAVARRPDIPLPAVTHARGRANVSQIGFVAFKDGTITSVSAGNNGNEDNDELGVRLPAGMLPTAMAVTPYNEFLVVSVWDTNSVSGKLAFISLRTRQMAVGSPSQTTNARYFWGLPGSWTVTDMKLLGFVDLPFAAPLSVEVSHNVALAKPRGFSDNDNPNEGDLARQSVRDRWFRIPANINFGDGGDDFDRFNADKWKQTAQHGYAVVSSRAENKVAFVDMAPLYRYYRSMYLTTPANYQRTTNQGPVAGKWPFTFSEVPEQRPVVVTTLVVPQPTAVLAGIRTNSSFGESRSDLLAGAARNNSLRSLAQRRAYVATMGGEVRMYDVSRLITPITGSPSVPSAPVGTFAAGRNATFAHVAGEIATAPDDVFVISRGDRSITYAFPNGAVQGVLKDSRLVDPVAGSVTVNQAGFGGRGIGRAVFANVITVTDFDGKKLVDYAIDALRDNTPEQYPFTTPTGRSLFLYGGQNAVPGKPFLITAEEII